MYKIYNYVLLTARSCAVKSRGVRYMYGIPDPFPRGPSLMEITFAVGKVWISFRVLIVATEVQSIDRD